MDTKKSLERKTMPGSILRKVQPYLYLLPLFVLLGVFKLYSSVYAVFRSFFEWDGGRISVFIGIQNYISLLSDATFGKSLLNLLILLVTSVIKVVTLPLLVAELVMSVKRELSSNLYKYLFVIPMVVPGVVMILLWRWIYDYNGLLNGFLSALGLENFMHSWLGEQATALGALVFYQFPWVAGIQFLIFLAGLQGIDTSIYEATKIDGIGPVSRIFYIDIPLLTGQFRYLIITTIISTFQTFEHVLIMTNGGPGDSTIVPALHMYNETFSYYNMGYACAMGTVLFLITLGITAFNMKYIKGAENQ
ncbi:MULTISPECIES: carbohydrate ABC transporter permease [Hungatella]|uniref:carbohydrate ABC transporter permease n=1 Tax=Hungatella TaxID=1649459 RepID=UPI002109D2B8|nr:MULTISPECIES: sugar ABC transporter permease [Hungatella]MCI6454982.1 sugar ABC transporter permease [Hungatella sp.]MCQ5387462.1 sugar ABC transporter permease [Hungatella hathewayi]